MHLLAQAMNDWLIAKDDGKTTTGVYIDISKAFYKVCHHPLLLRQHSAEIGGIALGWLANYLRHRYQLVITDTGSPTHLSFNRGVPQGSVIGPLLFHLYVSQLYLTEIAAAKAATLLMFAADRTQYTAQRDRTLAAAIATDALDAISDALIVLGLSINTLKTKTMFILPPHSTQDGNVVITYWRNPSDVVNHVQCLGVQVDDSLPWSHHADATIAQVSRKIGALKRE